MPIDPAAARLETDPELQRYSRQILFARIGVEHQRRLRAARVALIGCGALGSALANTLGRAGVGLLRIVDRDFIELNNLQRQTLFDEQDITDNLPKAEAAARKLARINSQVQTEPIVADVTAGNVESLVTQVDLVLDGTDNLETRFLINDACVKHGLPWIYGACLGATGMMMPILPTQTPCLRCVWPEPPPPGSSETCDTAGVLGPAIEMVSAWQAIEAFKILTGQMESVQRRLLQFDAWTGRVDWFDMQAALESGDCVCCKQRRFEFLGGALGTRTAVLCGRDAIQITPPAGTRIEFNEIARKLGSVTSGAPVANRFLMRFVVDSHEITLFPDGRAIIKGVANPDEARSLYSRYIGA